MSVLCARFFISFLYVCNVGGIGVSFYNSNLRGSKEELAFIVVLFIGSTLAYSCGTSLFSGAMSYGIKGIFADVNFIQERSKIAIMFKRRRHGKCRNKIIL